VPVDSARVGRYARAGARWGRLLVPRQRRGLRVFYGHDRIPEPGDEAAGGTAKLQKLAERFPNSPTSFTLLYLGNTYLPRDLRPLLWLARHRRIPVVVNQDGVGYPGWAGERTDEVNRPLRRALLAADHVVYQSAFSKRSSDLFLGSPPVSWEILHNAVDTRVFTPASQMPEAGPVLLLGGDQTQSYRLELALETLAALVPAHPEATLLVGGRLVSDPRPSLRRLGIENRVTFHGRYAQRVAPNVYRRAHLLLHTKVNDPCPTVVVEAMACGLPVVYPASGGSVELVGEEAGVGVAHDDGFERDNPPRAEALAEAVDAALGRLEALSVAARRRAVERFDIRPWLDRHAELFRQLHDAS
jgi:glycosyltransferase involved in cell wall biosynthesis